MQASPGKIRHRDRNVDLQPILEGERVLVRPLLPQDWAGMFAAAADPLIWEQHPASDRYREAVFRDYFDDALASGAAFTFIDKASGDIIGSSRYHAYDPVADEIEIGWTFLARAYWGGACNTEIKRLMLGHAFSFVNTVVFWIAESNLRSRRAVEKIGGRLRDGIHRRSETDKHPHVVYSIERPSSMDQGID